MSELGESTTGFSLAPAGQAYRLLERLRADRGRPVTIDQLLEASGITSIATLRIQMSQLQKSLGEQAGEVRAVPGVGYCWDEPAEQQPDPHGPGDEHDLILDVDTCRVFAEDHVIKLTPQQARILQELTARPERMVDVLTLQAATGVTSLRSVAASVNLLRRLLDPLHDSQIRNVRGLGYQYVGPPLRRTSS